MITKMLEKLKDQRKHIDFMIDYLENEIKNSNHQEKRKSIIKSVKSVKKHHKGLHWTQKPENKEKLRQMHIKAARTVKLRNSNG